GLCEFILTRTTREPQHIPALDNTPYSAHGSCFLDGSEIQGHKRSPGGRLVRRGSCRPFRKAAEDRKNAEREINAAICTTTTQTKSNTSSRNGQTARARTKSIRSIIAGAAPVVISAAASRFLCSLMPLILRWRRRGTINVFACQATK